MQLAPRSASVAALGLVNIADEVNEERQITVAAPFVAISLFEVFGVFVDLRGDAGSARTSHRHVTPAVLQTDVDEMPGGDAIASPASAACGCGRTLGEAEGPSASGGPPGEGKSSMKFALDGGAAGAEHTRGRSPRRPAK